MGAVFPGRGRVTLFTSLVSGHSFSIAKHRLLALVVVVVWEFIYFTYQWAVSGKTLGMAIFGIKVVSAEGAPIGFKAATIRTITLPISIFFFGIGLIGSSSNANDAPFTICAPTPVSSMRGTPAPLGCAGSPRTTRPLPPTALTPAQKGGRGGAGYDGNVGAWTNRSPTSIRSPPPCRRTPVTSESSEGAGAAPGGAWATAARRAGARPVQETDDIAQLIVDLGDDQLIAHRRRRRLDCVWRDRVADPHSARRRSRWTSGSGACSVHYAMKPATSEATRLALESIVIGDGTDG